MENNKKGFAPIIIALIVAVVLGGGYVAVSQYSKNKSQKLENQAKEKVNSSEISAQGVVVDNNLENPNIGAYFQIKRNDGQEDIFVVYKPFINKKESACLNKIDATGMGLGTLVEVRGIKIEKIDGVKPKSLMISTCESLEYYVRTVTDETANWKTYKNEKYGFEIQYPNTLAISNNLENGVNIRNSNSSDSISVWVEKINPEPKMHDVDEIKNTETYSLQGYTAKKLTGDSGVTGKPAVWIIFNRSGFYYTISASPEVIDRVLSTFKFTK